MAVTARASAGKDAVRRAVIALAVFAALVGMAVAFSARPAHAADFTVTNTDDTDADSLRQAITAANAAANSGGPDVIKFDIPGSGVKTITPASTLPQITDPVTIDGYSQPGASANTNPLGGGGNAVLLIEVSGGFSGLRVNANGSTIRGLAINRGGTSVGGVVHAIRIDGGGNVVEGNFLGTDPSGAAATDIGGGNPFGLGVDILSGANNVIGGASPAARNVVSGNVDGIRQQGGSGVVIRGNYIGTNAAGTAAATGSIQREGIEIFDAATNPTITGNLISGSTNSSGTGIDIKSNGGSIQGNLIGTQRDGTSPLGNGGAGIDINPGSNITVGGLAPGQANTIAFNFHGVTVRGPSNANSGGDNNNISGNSIHSNTRLGIDLGANGVTPNDPRDADNGPNEGQNFPALTTASLSGGNATISGMLPSTANTTFRLEFFANAECDPVFGFGEGQTYIGTANAATDGGDGFGGGNASFGPLSFPAPSGQPVITATATDPNGNTSEFSQCVTATGAPNAAPVANNDPAAPGDPNYATNEDYSLTVSEANGVLANDTDANGDTLTVATPRPTSGPSNGTLTLNANGSFIYTPSANFSGDDSFTYKATDGQAESNVATATITVEAADGDPPNTTITSGPPPLTKNKSATFRFTSTESGSTFECKLDLGGFSPCGSPKNYTNLSNGPHTFMVRATDAAVNTDPTPATRTWTVDAAKPTITALKPAPGSSTRSRTVGIRATVKDSPGNLAKSNIQLFVDGKRKTGFTYNRATGRLGFTGRNLSLGRHTVKITATDKAGNAAVRAWSFRVIRR